jgi:hypothetical protein
MASKLESSWRTTVRYSDVLRPHEEIWNSDEQCSDIFLVDDEPSGVVPPLFVAIAMSEQRLALFCLVGGLKAVVGMLIGPVRVLHEDRFER